MGRRALARRSGRTSRAGLGPLRALALLGQLGFLVVGGAFLGYGAGWWWDQGHGGRTGRITGLLVGLAGGIWAALKVLLREARKEEPKS